MTISLGSNSDQSYSKIQKVLFFCDGLHEKVRNYRRFDRPAPLLCEASSNPKDGYYTWIDEDGALSFSEHGPQGFDALFITRGQRFGYQGDEVLEKEAPARTSAITLEEERDNDADIPLPKARAGKEIVAA